MKPGDVRVFNGGKALAVTIGLWAKREKKYLRIDITGFGGHTTINNNPASVRYHRTLFRNMGRILVANGVLKFGEEGAETEEQS